MFGHGSSRYFGELCGLRLRLACGLLALALARAAGLLVLIRVRSEETGNCGIMTIRSIEFVCAVCRQALLRSGGIFIPANRRSLMVKPLKEIKNGSQAVCG